MLYKVESAAIECVTAIMKAITNWHYKSEILKELEDYKADNQHNDSPEFKIDFEWGMYAEGKVKLTPEGALAKDKYGDFVFEKFEVGGGVLLFLAFCFQKGELLLESREWYRGCENFAKDAESIFNTQMLQFKKPHNSYGITASEWREYIKNKYNFLPPDLYENFTRLFDFGIVVTGGLATGSIADETEFVKASKE
ncbi:MAG: hypothetical protein FWE74_05810 [Oscillospiraceae bacterium]|nr:hypothetical protein [Oscillospiraceae bacterium]